MASDEELEKHLEDFKSWGTNQGGSSSGSMKNYSSSVKKFYTTTGLKVIDPEKINQEKASQLTELLTTSISSRSMKYGLKKYFEFLSYLAPTMESQSRINFLEDKLKSMDFNVSERNIQNKVMSAERVGQLVNKAEETDEELELAYRMMYETATRASGMYLLEWRDVHRSEWGGEKLKDHEIFISKNRSKGKEDGVVRISDSTLSDLIQLKRDREEMPNRQEKVFFPEMTRESLYQKMWRVTKNVEESTHWFRHSRLTHLGMQMHQEEDLEYDTIKGRLQRYARHRDSKTTEIYIEIVKKKITRKNSSMEKYRQVEW